MAGVIFTGAISIGTVVTVFYGVNTIFSSTVDMTFCFSGNGEKLGSFNFIRDSVFGNIGQFFSDVSGLDKRTSKERSNIAYLVSELIVAGTGIRSIFKELQTGWKIGKGYVSIKPIKTRLYNSPGMGGGGKEIYFERLGYHVYQIFDSLKSGKGYVVQIYKEAKEIETKSKVKFTNSSAIELIR